MQILIWPEEDISIFEFLFALKSGMVEAETIREDTGMDFYAQYKNKLVSVEEAVLSIQSGETVAFAQAGSCPNVICQHMTLRLHDAGPAAGIPERHGVHLSQRPAQRRGPLD